MKKCIITFRRPRGVVLQLSLSKSHWKAIPNVTACLYLNALWVDKYMYMYAYIESHRNIGNSWFSTLIISSSWPVKSKQKELLTSIATWIERERARESITTYSWGRQRNPNKFQLIHKVTNTFSSIDYRLSAE